jgi:hypothetical protein
MPARTSLELSDPIRSVSGAGGAGCDVFRER